MPSILLFHDAIGSSVQLEPLAYLFIDSFKVNLLNFSGHGGKSIPTTPFQH